MRKIILIASLTLSVFYVDAQKLEFGVMFAPNISSNRLSDEFDKTDTLSIEKAGSGIRFSAGPILDFYIQDNIAISLGALYTVKRASFTFQSDISGATTFKPVVNLQYVSIPVGLKFMTNEIANQAKLYFQLGGNLDLKIDENIKNKKELEEKLTGEITKKLAKAIDVGLNIGAGIEMKLGSSNAVFLGLSYNRGLINLLTGDFGKNLENDIKNGIELNKKKVKINNDLFSIVVGFKF